MLDFNEISSYILTPESRICRAEKIRLAGEGIKTYTPSHFTLNYTENGEKPYIILDLGKSSPGGYPVFKVKSHEGQPVLRIAYSDWYPYLLDKEHRDKGDFTRGCCKYLGVELPVLPGNPNRFENYTVSRNGKFIYPLIQGQQRFVLLTLDSIGAVEIEDFYIYYTSDMGEYSGYFKCSDTKLDKLWYSSTYTAQIASVESAQSWEAVENTLLLRALTKGNPMGIYKDGGSWDNYEFRFTAQISVNPDCPSGIGWVIRADSTDNGYVFQLSLDGIFRWYIRENSADWLVGQKYIKLGFCDNCPFETATCVNESEMKVYLNGELILSWTDSTYKKGSIGFVQTAEKWAVVEKLSVSDNGRTLFQDDFSGDITENYTFTVSLPFIADGAKRDRLPWIGDLDWAGRNIYYAFSDYKYMWGSLMMFARHQTPEGYIWGTCYPENTDNIRSGEYGYYESDIFSAWFVPTLWDYLLFTGKTGQVKTLLGTAVKDLDYLWSNVGGNGLFFQRYATSKGLWDHELNDIGYFSYNNIIVYDAMLKGAFIARECGEDKLYEKLLSRAVKIKNAVMKYLWCQDRGCFNKGLNSKEYCHMANSLALAVGILTDEQALTVKESLVEWFPHNPVYGKIVSLFIRGCFKYGFDSDAIKALTGKTGIQQQNGNTASVNWIDSIEDENGPATTTECMMYPPALKTDGEAWGDRSHPDTAVAHLLSGYILGVEPVECGFRKFRVSPHCCNLSSAKGIIPTPSGKISVDWSVTEKGFVIDINHPEGTCPIIELDRVPCEICKININGLPYETTKAVNL